MLLILNVSHDLGPETCKRHSFLPALKATLSLTVIKFTESYKNFLLHITFDEHLLCKGQQTVFIDYPHEQKHRLYSDSLEKPANQVVTYWCWPKDLY